MSQVTPMMQQYLEIKEQYKDCILFFRLGDFYEMFYDDAEVASKELEITLTGKDCGLDKRAPMCGVPYHAADNYIAKLIDKGFKVAICEQVEDPALAKGLVKRDVVKIVTPGTVTESSMLDEKRNNYLMSVYKSKYYFGIATVDVSTGEFLSTQISWGNTRTKLLDEIAKFSPSEIIVNGEMKSDTNLLQSINNKFEIYISEFDDKYFDSVNAKNSLKQKFGEGFDAFKDYDLSMNASGALVEYLTQTQKVNLDHIQTINIYRIEEYMGLDITARRNLELTESMRDKSRKGTLIWVLDKTMTSMGGRTIRKWIEQPLINIEDINLRLDAVNEFKEKFMVRAELREQLKRIYDIERLIGKVVLGNVNCRDLVALKNSLGQLPYIKMLMEKCESQMNVRNFENLDVLDDIYKLIDLSINDDPPMSLKDGGIIKNGFNVDVDKFRSATNDGKKWILDLESKERINSGIKNLKVGFNRIFGYYIEVTKSNYEMVPETYIRKQTLANCERYITEELKELENTVLGAEEKLMGLEYEIFTEIRDEISKHVNRIKITARCISEIDVICSFAEVADRENYCMPQMTVEDEILIEDGRHPVVEKVMDSGSFVPNNTKLNMEENRLAIITGPNMAGKSTYMRQVAIIVLMAQIGCFVPAKSATIGIVDKIFTRVGATDDLASGQSTFMVEMNEVANIISNATPKSLLILDEIGRGTSTFDGLSIAWAVIEFISDKEKIGCRTLFATHYHELTELEGKLTGVKNYCILVEEDGEDIIFLRKIIRGGADASYGIQVARLAGIPMPVIDRAKDILTELENSDISKKEIKVRRGSAPIEGQLDIASFNNTSKSKNEIIEELKNIDISKLTPLDALNELYELQKRARK